MRKITFITTLIAFAFNTTASSANVNAYFNHFEGASYTDPYRGITRDGHNLEAVIIKNINRAQKSIYIAVQEIRLPLIAQALIKKKQEGVDVRVIIENSYNNISQRRILSKHEHKRITEEEDEELSEHDAARSMDLRAFIDLDHDGRISISEMAARDAIYMLKKGKIEIKDDTFDFSYGSGLMHHKFIVIDERFVVESSANFTLSGIHGDFLNPQSRGNANSLIEIESSKLAHSFSREFLYMWGGNSGENGSRFGLSKPYRGIEKTSVDGDSVAVQFSPVSKKQPWQDSVNGLIGKEIKKSTSSALGALFVFSDQRIANELQKKVLEVNDYDFGLLVERKFAYRPYSELLDIWGISMRNDNCDFEPDNRPWRKPFYDVGVPNLNSGDLLHHKFIVLDNETVIVGSQNWSASANHTNDENVLVIKNKQIASLFTEEYLRLKRVSTLGPPRSLILRASEQNRRCVLSDNFL